VENTLESIRVFGLFLKVSDDTTYTPEVERDEDWRRVWDSASLTVSRHSINPVALSPVNCRTSLRWVSSMSALISFLITSRKSKSPVSSCSALGRERRRSIEARGHHLPYPKVGLSREMRLTGG